ncbi:MAG: hypothetical protein HDS27_05760 [Bacteroides sp.]|nr:hypothetical protein [Bacteroides sp.]
MKTLSIIKNVLPLVFLIFLSGDLQAKDHIKYIRHFDYAKSMSAFQPNKSFPMKTQRVSSGKGEINLIFYADIPDSIMTAIMVAKELWESKLHNRTPIYIEVNFEPLEDGTVLSTEIGMEEENNNFIPIALASQLREYRDDVAESPDGYICLNSDLKWNCSFLNGNSESYNVTTMMLRGIARCLGFVTSIQQSSNDRYSFFDRCPTVFDSHLYNGSSCLSNFESYSKGLADFVTSENVYFRSQAAIYPIHSPTKYVQGESLCYLKDSNSLMSQSLGVGNVFLDIDDPTIDILNALGWNLPSKALGIKCTDLDVSGLGSCYNSHHFTLAENDLHITRYQWSFSLKNKEGKYEHISHAATKDFTINRIAEPDKFYTNTNGDLEGKIECNYYVDGIEYSAEPYRISLEQKPIIISVSTPVQTWNNYNFSLDFNVNYTGADKIDIRIEEEYDYNMLVLTIEEPIIAHVTTGLISGLYYSWVTISASNRYGTIRKTLEFPPLFDTVNNNHSSTSIDEISYVDADPLIQVFNLQGHLMYEGVASDFHETSVTPGLYMKKTTLDSGKSIISKILIK